MVGIFVRIILMDRRTSLLLAALVATGALWLLHFLANFFYLYWVWWWYDVAIHFLAGLAGGLATYWCLFHSGILFKKPISNFLAATLSVLICVMIVGVGWEVFEYVNGFTDSHEGYALDTINDLVLDGSGAVLAALIGVRKRRNSNG